MDPMPPLRTLRLPVAGAVEFFLFASLSLPQNVRRLPFREPGAPGLLYQSFGRSALLARRAAPLRPALGVVVFVPSVVPARSVKRAV